MKSALVVLVAASACTPPATRPLTASAFQEARTACHAEDAYIIDGPVSGIGFRGIDPAHAEQARCLMAKLIGTRAKIGFISEPPK